MLPILVLKILLPLRDLFGYLCIVLTVLSVAGCADKSPEEMYAKGLTEIRKSNPNGAIVYFLNALAVDQNFYEARLELAKVYRQAGRFELSESEFAKLQKSLPIRPKLLLELVRLHIARKKNDLALKELEEYARMEGLSPDYYELSGIAHVADNRPAKAIACYLQALRLEPSRTSVKLELAGVYLFFRITDKREEAKRLINEVLQSNRANVRAYYLMVKLEEDAGNRDEVIKFYTTISELDNSDVVAPYQLGLLYLEKGELGKAEEIASRLRKAQPKSMEGITLTGIVFSQKNMHSEAISTLRKAIEVRPTSEANYFLGVSHFKRGEFEYALTQLGRVAEKSFFSPAAKCLTALIYIKQKRTDDAISLLGKFLAANPSNALAHNLLGSAYLAKGMNTEGIKELKQAIEIAPKNIDSRLKRGVAYLMQGNGKAAEDDFICASHIAPELVESRLMLSDYYQYENDHDNALTILEQGITGKKSDAVLYGKMAAISFAWNKPIEALGYLQKAKQANPDNLEYFFAIATYYSDNNQPEKALKEYREIIDKHPGNAKALLGMATLLEISGNLGEAKASYKKSLKSKDPAAYVAMATFLMRQKKIDAAISVLDDGIKTITGNVGAMLLKVQILASQKKFSEAMQVCEDIVQINPQQGLQSKVGIYLQWYGNYQNAIEAARHYITMNPKSAFGHMLLADIYDIHNDQTNAVKELKEGIRREGGSNAALVKLGDLFAKQENYKAAMDTYGEVIRKTPHFVPAIFAQGKTLELLGKRKDAVTKYKEALRKSSNYVPALNNLAYLYINEPDNLREGLRMAYIAFRLEPSNSHVLDTLGLALLKNKQVTLARQVLEKANSIAPPTAARAYHLALAFHENDQRDLAVKKLRECLTLGDFPNADDARRLLNKLK